MQALERVSSIIARQPETSGQNISTGDVDVFEDTTEYAESKQVLSANKERSLMSHVPIYEFNSARLVPKGRPNASLRTAVPDYDVFVQYGKALLLDDMYGALKEHFEEEQERAKIEVEMHTLNAMEQRLAEQRLMRKKPPKHYEALQVPPEVKESYPVLLICSNGISTKSWMYLCDGKL